MHVDIDAELYTNKRADLYNFPDSGDEAELNDLDEMESETEDFKTRKRIAARRSSRSKKNRTT